MNAVGTLFLVQISGFLLEQALVPLTGARWLMVRLDAAAFRAAQLHDNAPRYEDERSIHRNGTRVRLRVTTKDGSLRLYEFGAR